jgi:hypothetical protein
MRDTLPPWLLRVVDDLRAVSADLLEPGIAKSMTVGALGGHGPLLRGLLALADAYAALAPRVLAEVDFTADGSIGDWRTVRVPRSARPSRAPYDYALHLGQPVPIRWLRFEAAERPNEPALRWALHLALRLEEELRTHLVRVESQFQEALLVRAGEDEYAVHDAEALRGLVASVQQRLVALRQCEAEIRNVAGRQIAPSDRPPSPFPQQAAWIRLKRIARELLNPESMLGTVLNQVLAEPIPMADVPFLYQRWCGLQLLHAFERQGWELRGQLVGPLFLGGRVEMVRAHAASVVVWVEPRVSPATMALTGWGVPRGKRELTPDFLITCGAAGLRDAFVLDATLSRNPEILEEKSKYRLGIVGVDTQFVAGVAVQRRPVRSWAVAPLFGSNCRLSDPEGRTGTIPLHPAELDLGPLDAWVADVSLHARRQMIASEQEAA